MLGILDFWADIFGESRFYVISTFEAFLGVSLGGKPTAKKGLGRLLGCDVVP